MVTRSDQQGSGRPYHHGNLRKALLEAAVEVIEESGAAALRLRDLARRVGVSHAAPANHFRDRADVLLHLALEGTELLAAMHQAVLDRHRDCSTEALNGLGVAYVEFAVRHRAHFEVMFLRELASEPRLIEAGRRNFEMLVGAVADVQRERGRSLHETGPSDAQLVALGCWATVHGFATLHAQGLLPGVDVSAVPLLAEQAMDAMKRMASRQDANH